MNGITVPLEGRPETAPGSDILIGTDGNAFAVMGMTSKALRRAGASAEYVKAYQAVATSGDYDHLLAASMAFLDAEQDMYEAAQLASIDERHAAYHAEREEPEMTTETLNPIDALPDVTTCVCGSVLTGADAFNVKRHEQSKKHRTYVAAHAAAPDRGETESAVAYVDRVEATLGEAYATWAESDPGQVALKAAADEAAAGRREARKAESRAVKLTDKVTVTHRSGTVPSETEARAGTARLRAEHGVTNRELKLGSEPIVIDGERYWPVLGRNGEPLEKGQEGDWIWHCPTCGRRLRAATCEGREGKEGVHAAVAAPPLYRRDSRRVS